MKLLAALALASALSACAGRTPTPEPTIVYRDAPIAVAAGCVVDRPAPVVPLRDRVPPAEWAARAPGAKAQAIAAQAGRRMNHQARTDAATSGCAAAN
ncbi:hypothetical protein [Sphingomonas abaci]|uniref:Lipoprotein n=1 Tax=Sphingomonas abaci TaxID=237611 RepID=A0A7W7EY82_9SPHN|nr:hypothetical protein [Sphingomonas abaci]MBB4617896.1 hypothetical protein [Sphingomonas abaci]